MEEEETDAQCAMSKYDLRDEQDLVENVVVTKSYGKLYSAKVARAVWGEIPH